MSEASFAGVDDGHSVGSNRPHESQASVAERPNDAVRNTMSDITDEFSKACSGTRFEFAW